MPSADGSSWRTRDGRRQTIGATPFADQSVVLVATLARAVLAQRDVAPAKMDVSQAGLFVEAIRGNLGVGELGHREPPEAKKQKTSVFLGVFGRAARHGTGTLTQAFGRIFFQWAR